MLFIRKKADPNPPLWDWSRNGESALVRVRGEIDYSVTPGFRAFLHRVAQETTGMFRLELSELDYLDSSGLAVIIELRRLLVASGRSLRVSSAKPQVRRIFDLTQVTTLLGLEDPA